MGRRNRDLKHTEELILGMAILMAMALYWLGIWTFLAALFILLLVIAFAAFLIFRGKNRRPPSDYIYHTGVISPTQQAYSSTPLPPSLPANITERLRELDWFQFEKIVGITYTKLGYTVTRRGGANPDGGIDLIIEKDGLRQAVQCKQWKTWNVGVKPVREFLGALTDSGISSGILVTLGGYTGEAKALADKNGIQILNETHLSHMLESVDARYDPEILAALQDTRKFCPKCEREMVLRTAKKGPTPGSQFWGCSGYPDCRFTMPI